jgi:hypothetical protein
MKRTLRILMLALTMVILFAVSLPAQENQLVRGHYQPGNIQFGGDIGLQFAGGDLVLAGYPQAEFMLLKFRPLGLFSMDVGAQVFGRLQLGLGAVAPGLGLGAGGMATLHIGLNGLNAPGLEMFQPIDIVSSFGAGFDISQGRLVFAAEVGFQYFLSPGLAARLMYRNFGSSSEATVGLVIKLGPAEEGEVADIGASVRAVSEGIEAIEGTSVMLQFSVFNAMSLGYWGYSWVDLDPSSDDGSVWRIRDAEGNEFLITRSRLSEENGGTWNKLVYESDGERILFEYFLDPLYELLELRYLFPDGEPGVYYPQPGEYQAPPELVTDAAGEFGLDYLGEELVRVPAGNFTADHYRGTEDGANYDFWLSNQVPGSMVKYEFNSGDGNAVVGELYEIIRQAEGELGDY